MVDIALAVTQRELIKDPAVIEEFDRAFARLNGALKGIGVDDAADKVEEGDPSDGIPTSTGPLIFPPKEISLSSDIVNLDPENFNVVRVTAVGATRTIFGIKGGIDGRILRLYAPNDAGQALVLAHEGASAQADRRIALVGAADITTPANEARGWELLYDGTARRWVQLGGSAAVAVSGVSVVFHDTTQGATTAVVTEEDLVTATLAANTLTTDGDALVIRAYGNFANNAQGKRLRFYWNGTAVADTTAQAWQDQGWQLHVILHRTGSAAQKGHAQFIPAVAGASPQPGDFFSDTADLTGTVAIKITGQNSIATANDITFEGWHAYKIKAAA